MTDATDELDEVDPWEEGDLGVLSDLGLPEPVLSVIVAQVRAERAGGR